jgi:hypothetical protein
MNRTAVINKLIETFGYESYLELGTDNRILNFNHVNAKDKYCVDIEPKAKADFTGSTDDFFKQSTKKWDLVFVDALHYAPQAKKDIENALEALNPNGTVVVHDCNPTTKEMQIVPRMQGVWTGDVWRAWVELRQRDDLFMTVLDTDYGVGVIRKGKQEPLIIEEPTYEQFEIHKKEWLNLVPVENDPVSVVIPAFEQYGHGTRTLKKLLETIKTQKGQFEVVVSDNSLNSHIKDLCAEYGVNYYHNPKRGISANTNYALDKASHEIVKIMYQDDMFMSDEAIETIAFAMKFNNWVACSGVRVDDFDRPGKPCNPKYTDSIMKGKNTLGMPSVIAHRKNELRFDENLRVMLDCEFYYLLNQKYGEPGYVKKPIISPRYWKGSTSVKQGNRNYLSKEVEYLTNKHKLRA